MNDLLLPLAGVLYCTEYVVRSLLDRVLARTRRPRDPKVLRISREDVPMEFECKKDDVFY